MKNVHVLPTEKPSKLIHNVLGYGMTTDEFTKSDLDLIQAQFQHIYITDDSEIEEGDKSILYVKGFEPMILTHHEHIADGYKGKKIILTTDTDLIADGIQGIDDAFLEWFVQNSTCEVVGVGRDSREVGNHLGGTSIEYADYEITLPQDEAKEEGYICPQTKIQCDDECCVSAEDCHIEASIGVLSEPKQEPIEEFIEKEGYEEGVFSPHIWSDGVRAGAKWQAERMYSEEDMIAFMQFIVSNQELENTSSVSRDTAKYYLEQFKKQKS